MARISFSKFKRALDSGNMPPERLALYVQLDADFPIPKLIFRPRALTDSAPPRYNVDKEVCRHTRRCRHNALESSPRDGQKVSVVAEGDSWMDLPGFLRRFAIADQLEKRSDFRVNNIAQWGHTLKKILRDKEYITVLAMERPDYFLFSAGGNDLQVLLAKGKLLHDYDPQIPIENHLTSTGFSQLGLIEDGYETVFSEVSRRFRKIQILCHGYDFPRPTIKNNKYIGKYLREQGYPKNVMPLAGNLIVRRLSEVIERAAGRFSRVTYIDCHNATADYRWSDDMHPSNNGFDALADAFEQQMI